MSIRNLTRLFKPRSIALIGTGGRPESVGATVGCNLRRGSFAGPIMVVEPDGPASPGGSTSKSVAELPQTPDLAIIASPAETVPGLIAELGSRGCAAALVLTAGFGTEAGAGTLRQAMLDAARPSLLRILGPRSLGVAVPAIGLDATFAPVAPLPGGIAWISQSGAVLTTLVDWATSRSIGFSHVVSLGDMADVDTGDLLDYLAGDSATRSILVYLERVSSARKFMSAARAAARSKPLIVVKSGRFASAREAKPETAGQPDADRIYEAAFQRAGMLRVRTLDAMFAALETLGHGRSYTGDRLAILTNGGGLGMLAADALVERGGGLAILDPATLSALDAVLPPGWSRGNPIDIGADGPAACYGDALERIVADRGVDACLVLNAPQAAAVAAADAVLATTARMDPRARAKVFVSWLGEGTAPDVRTRFETAGLPSYDTPERAVAGFMHMLEYRRNQVLLMRVPPSMPEEFDADRARARTIVEVAHAAGRSWLDRTESWSLLAAYGIPVGPIQPLPGEAAAGAAQPEGRFEGFTVDEPADRTDALRLRLGLAADPIFGPVVFLDRSRGRSDGAEDTAVALVPLDLVLAHDLIRRAGIHRHPAGPAADLDGIALTLVELAQMAADLPELFDLEIDPLLAGPGGVVALGARIRIGDPAERPEPAILPYPSALESDLTLPDGTVLLIRPVRPEDAPRFEHNFALTLPADIHSRFFGSMNALPQSLLARLTQLDYDREMALAALPRPGEGDAPDDGYGVVRLAADPDMDKAEFAVIVRSDWHGRGLGRALMHRILDYARARGIAIVWGTVLHENRAMITLLQSLGFRITRDDDPGTVHAEIRLGPEATQEHSGPPALPHAAGP